jgi:hypothetical protein
LAEGSSETWDDAGLDQPVLVKVGSEWQLWYSGYDGTDWNAGVATCSTLLGTYSKSGSNPIISRDSSIYTSTASGSSGNTLKVDSTTGFAADMAILIDDDSGTKVWFTRIRKVVDSTTLELYHEIQTPSTSKRVAAITQGSLDLSSLFQDGANWYASTVAFQIDRPGGGFFTPELSAFHVGVGSDPKSASWSVQWKTTPPAVLSDLGAAREGSRENLKFPQYPVPEDEYNAVAAMMYYARLRRL